MPKFNLKRGLKGVKRASKGMTGKTAKKLPLAAKLLVGGVGVGLGVKVIGRAVGKRAVAKVGASFKGNVRAAALRQTARTLKRTAAARASTGGRSALKMARAGDTALRRARSIGRKRGRKR